MSWHFSRVAVEAYSAVNCADLTQFARLRLIHTADQFYWPGKTTGHSRLSRFGMTCEPLTEKIGVDALMWFRQGSRASLLALQEKEKPKKTTGICGRTPSVSFAKFDRVSRSWKMFPALWEQNISGKFSLTCAKRGMMRNGILYRRPILEPRTYARGSGFWLSPSVTLMEGGENRRESRAQLWPNQIFVGTPTAGTGTKGRSAKWRKGKTPNPQEFVRMWPTPTQKAQNANSPGEHGNGWKDLQTVIGGALNPSFVEWLMGWPYEWTNLNERWIPFSRKEITEDCLRIMWCDEKFTESPQGREFKKQFRQKYPNLVRYLSHEKSLEEREKTVEETSSALHDLWQACYSWPLRNTQKSFKEAWESTPIQKKCWIGMAVVFGIWHAEWAGVPRLTKGISNRVDRLKALGNGQVPGVAALALEILKNRMESNQ